MTNLSKNSMKNLNRRFSEWTRLVKTRIYRLIPTPIYIRLMYYHITGIKLNLKNPKTFTEKLQWMKLHYRNPLYTEYADKLKVREYIAQTIGDEYLVPLLGVYDKADDIDFDKLPDQFVLKCNHDSGSFIFCRDKSDFDIKDAKAKLTKHLNTNFYYPSREWQYKDIKPKILCEKFLTDEMAEEIQTCRFFCFSGEPKLIQVVCGKFTDIKVKYYYIDWTPIISTVSKRPEPDMTLDKPHNLDEMLRIAAKLSDGFPHVRVDLYVTPHKIYFNEMTFFDLGGNRDFKQQEFNVKMGGWLELPEKNYSRFGRMG